MSIPTPYELERDILPMIRADILLINDQRTRDALFSLLGLVHDLATELHQRSTP